MKGTYEVRVTRRRGTSYRFTIRRNITIVRGDSASGKTTLFGMIADHARLGDKSGVNVQCDVPCVALADSDWRNQLAGFSNSIVFIDEGLRDLLTDDFARAVRGSSNYFIIITRADLPALPYSVDEIYQIKMSGKYHSLVPCYLERGRHRYALAKATPKADFDVLLTEDSKSGLQFFEKRLAETGVFCSSAKTNAAILSWLDLHLDSHVFVVADGAAFGAFADRVLKLQDSHRDNITVCLPESFEWLLLASGLIKSDEVSKALAAPSDYVDSSEHMSWEQFFTDLLKKETKGTSFEYGKANLAEAYSMEENASKVMALIACRNIR